MKVKCLNCGNKENFARDCIKPKKVKILLTLVSVINIFSSILLTKSNPLWIIDLGPTDHVAKDRDAFMEFQRLSHGAR